MQLFVTLKRWHSNVAIDFLSFLRLLFHPFSTWPHNYKTMLDCSTILEFVIVAPLFKVLLFESFRLNYFLNDLCASKAWKIDELRRTRGNVIFQIRPLSRPCQSNSIFVRAARWITSVSRRATPYFLGQWLHGIKPCLCPCVAERASRRAGTVGGAKCLRDLPLRFLVAFPFRYLVRELALAATPSSDDLPTAPTPERSDPSDPSCGGAAAELVREAPTFPGWQENRLVRALLIDDDRHVARPRRSRSISPISPPPLPFSASNIRRDRFALATPLR